MKLISTTLLAMCFAFSGFAQQTLPYSEDFESGQGGWTINNAAGNGSWAFGTPAGNEIIGASSGDSAFATGNLVGNYNPNEGAYIESPLFDFTTFAGNENFVLDVWWDSENSWDGANVFWSADSGATFQLLGFFGAPNNWYTDNSLNSSPGGSQEGWTGTGGNSSNGWVTAEHPIPAALFGAQNVFFRIYFGSDGSVQNGDGVGIDNIQIFGPPIVPINGAISNINGIEEGCGLGTETYDVVYVNEGTDTLIAGSTFDLTLDNDITGPSTTNVNLAADLAPGDSITLPFLIDVSAPGLYNFTAYVDQPGDTVQSNDTLTDVSTRSIALAGPLPYFEDFEADEGGWFANNTDLGTWEWGTPAATFIDTTAPNGGENAWVTNLDGDYNNDPDNGINYLESPCFDFSALTTDPVIFFAHIFDNGGFGDEGWMETSIDSGQTWQRVLNTPADQNWYNDLFNNEWDGNSGDPGVWRQARNILTGTAGFNNVRIRFAQSANGFTSNEGFGVDNIQVEFGIIDGSTETVLGPNNGCNLTASETVVANFLNRSNDTIFQFDACYIVDGGAPVCETVNDTIPVGAFYTYTFATGADLSTVGTYEIDVVLALPGDVEPANDTASRTVDNVLLASFPYSEDFESGNGGWLVDFNSTDPSWELGYPNSTNFNPFIVGTADCDSNAFVTNLTANANNGEFSYLVSPCFDFSTLTEDPYIGFDQIFDIGTFGDRFFLEMTLDSGQTWTTVGPSGNGFNWYNNGTEWNGVSGPNGEWRSAYEQLTGSAGSATVQLRFVIALGQFAFTEGVGVDNIVIDSEIEGVELLSTTVPSPDCGLGAAETITIEIQNTGSETLVGFDACYIINGGAPVCEVPTDSVMPGQTFMYTFTTTVDFSMAGEYEVQTYVSNTGATAPSCGLDTATTITANTPVVDTYPYFEDFENGRGGWLANNDNNGTWGFGAPSGLNFTETPSGVNVWQTGQSNASMLYNSNDDSYVSGPCFDFTNLPAGAYVGLTYRVESEFSWDGSNLQVSTDSGATWTNVGGFGDDFNWYNDNTINGAPGGSQEGWTGRGGRYRHAKSMIDSSLYGLSNVRYRVTFASDGSVQVAEGFTWDNFVIGVPMSTVDLGPDQTQCGGFVLDIGPGDYEWFTQDTATLAVTEFSTDQTPRFDNNTDSTIAFNVIVRSWDSIGLCALDTMLLSLLPAPTNNLGVDQAVCVGDTLELNAVQNANHTFLWNDATMSTADSLLVTEGGEYILTATDINTGCANNDTINIFQIESVDLATTTLICAGAVETLDVDSIYSVFDWSTGDSTASIVLTGTDTIYLTVTDSFGCVSNDSTFVELNQPPTVSITGGPTAGDTVYLNCTNPDQTTYTLDAGAGFSSYSWTTGATDTTQTVSFDGDVAGPGVTIISVTVIDGNGCTGTDQVAIITSDVCTGP